MLLSHSATGVESFQESKQPWTILKPPMKKLFRAAVQEQMSGVKTLRSVILKIVQTVCGRIFALLKSWTLETELIDSSMELHQQKLVRCSNLYLPNRNNLISQSENNLKMRNQDPRHQCYQSCWKASHHHPWRNKDPHWAGCSGCQSSARSLHPPPSLSTLPLEYLSCPRSPMPWWRCSTPARPDAQVRRAGATLAGPSPNIPTMHWDVLGPGLHIWFKHMSHYIYIYYKLSNEITASKPETRNIEFIWEIMK